MSPLTSPERPHYEHLEHDPDDIGFVESFEEVIELTYPRIIRRYQDAERRRNEFGNANYAIPQSLIIAAGHEGAGKTRVTKRRLELWSNRVVVVEKDPISNKFSTGRSDRKDPVHGAMRPTVYRAMYHYADELLKLGMIPVLDAPFNKFEDFFHNPEWAAHMRDIAARYDAEVRVIWCEASPETRYNRIVARGAAQDAERTEEHKRALVARTDRPNTDLPMFVFNTEDTHEAEALRTVEGLKGFLGASPVIGMMPMERPDEIITAENAREAAEAGAGDNALTEEGAGSTIGEATSD